MLKGQARKRLGKRAKKGFRGFPLATIAFYGPDGSRATKLVVGIILEGDQEPAELRRWLTEGVDIREPGSPWERVRGELQRPMQTVAPKPTLNEHSPRTTEWGPSTGAGGHGGLRQPRRPACRGGSRRRARPLHAQPL